MQDPQKLQEENERLKAELDKVTSAQKQKDSFLKKSILNITAPQIWKGVALGIALSILTYNIVRMDAAMFAVKLILAVGVILAIGFLAGQWAVKRTQQKALETLNNTFSTSKGTTSNLISTLYQIVTGKKISKERTKELSNTVNEYKPLLIHGGNWIVAVILRIMAFSSLMGVLAIAVSFAIAIATFMQVELLEKQNKKLDKQNILLEQQDSLLGNQNQLLIAQNKRLDQQTNLQEAERRSSLVFLFSNIMDAVDRELKDSKNKKRILSKQLIGRIIALSASLKPYKYLTKGDTLTSKLLSPERGQLLISLINSDISDITESSILMMSEFESADLQGANLGYANLNNVRLNNANLEDATLTGANLEDAYLTGTNFRYVNLEDANLRNALLGQTNLSFSDLSCSDLSNSFLCKSNMFFSNLEGANLRGADLREADLWGTYLVGADLHNAKVHSLNFLTELAQSFTNNIELQERYYVDSIPQYKLWDYKKRFPYYLIKPKSTQD